MAEEEHSWRSVGFVAVLSFFRLKSLKDEMHVCLTVTAKTQSCNMRNGHESLVRTLHH